MALTAAQRRRPARSFVYAWEGMDRRGARVRGETRAPNLTMVRAELRRQGVSPTKVKRKARPLLGPGRKRITSRDIAVFSRQLATMMSAGVPLVQAFEIVGRGHDNPAMQDLILSIKADLESGTALTLALSKHPAHFDRLFCSLVAAGEHAGVLDVLLGEIATYKEKTESIKGKIRKALFYPAAVVIVALAVTSIIMIFVVPQFKALFSSFDADLPVFSLLVIAASDFMRQWWLAIALALAAAAYLLRSLSKRSVAFRDLADRTALALPLIGPIIHKAAVARFSRTLATMSAAGVPLVEALDSVAGATGSNRYAKAVSLMREEVSTGQALHVAMRQLDLFPHMVIQMTAIGEESGALDELLAKVADFYEEEVNNAVDSLSSLLEPFVMVLIGGLVGGMVVAMYLPVFRLAAVV